MACLHNTTTDEIEGCDVDLLPLPAQQRWQRLQEAFAHASDQVRRERAPSLQLDPCSPSKTLLLELRRRAASQNRAHHQQTPHGAATPATWLATPVAL